MGLGELQNYQSVFQIVAGVEFLRRTGKKIGGEKQKGFDDYGPTPCLCPGERNEGRIKSPMRLDQF